jgi:hypothetical protein
MEAALHFAKDPEAAFNDFQDAAKLLEQLQTAKETLQLMKEEVARADKSGTS